ncbi:MAG: molybdate ABC transporter substrate-binding protein [Spongiibacteraceae bacterium]|jgi:molybdate transport system substrate-binding protein|nr:molybdate ABC transporter substrate-binding protein [Spongiibacteraceae bacterium]
MNPSISLLCRLFLCCLLLTGLTYPLAAAEVRVAAAANFATALRELTPLFEVQTGHRVVLSLGATGLLYAQISHGAPYDVFLAADATTPRQLIDAGRAVPESYFIYARGRLVLWSRQADYVDGDGQVLSHGTFSRLAVANPQTAPYGAAAYETMTALGVLNKLRGKLITGENIAQTLQFVHSGNVPLGFVGLAQVRALPPAERGSHWLVPASYHQPIRQAAVLLNTARERTAAESFLAFLRSPEAAQMLERLGYEPEPGH